MNKNKVIITILMFLMGLISPIIMIGIKEGLFNPYLLLIILIPLAIWLRVHNYRLKRKMREINEEGVI